MSQQKSINFIKHNQVQKAFSEWKQTFFKIEEPPPTVEKEEDDVISNEKFQKEVVEPNMKTDADKMFLMTLSTQIKIQFKQQLNDVSKVVLQLANATPETQVDRDLEDEMKRINSSDGRSWWQTIKSFLKKLYDIFNSRPVHLIFWIIKTIVSKFVSLSKFVFSNPRTARILTILAIRYRDALCKEFSIWLNFYKVSNQSESVFDWNNLGQMKDLFFSNFMEQIQVFAEGEQFDTVWNSTALILSSASLYLLPGIGMGIFASVLQQPILKQFLVTFNEALKMSVRTSIQMAAYLSEMKETWKMLFDSLNFSDCIHPVILSQEELAKRPWAGSLKGVSSSLFSESFLESHGFKPDVAKEIDKLLFSSPSKVLTDEPEICPLAIESGLATPEINWIDYLSGINFFNKNALIDKCRLVDVFSEDFNKRFQLNLDSELKVLSATQIPT